MISNTFNNRTPHRNFENLQKYEGKQKLLKIRAKSIVTEIKATFDCQQAYRDTLLKLNVAFLEKGKAKPCF